MSRTNAQLSKKHLEQLKASGLSDGVITARGYRSIREDCELEEVGFKRFQVNPPGLLVPVMWRKEVVLHQFRADVPRTTADGKAVKYEPPLGARSRLDCPLSVTPYLADTSVRLVCTEGVKKADAAASVGICCIAFLGVWNWQRDGVPLADWDDVGLLRRDVFVAYDSDVMTKDSVQQARQELTLFLARQGARVRWIHLPPGKPNVNGSESKVGLDDYLAAGHTVDELFGLAREPAIGIRVGRSLPAMTRDAIGALAVANEPPVVFQRDDMLVEARTVGVQRMTPARLRYRLTEAADWQRVSAPREGPPTKTPVVPPAAVVENVAVADDLWSFPRLDRIVNTPVFAKDGSLRIAPGYHEPSRSLYIPSEGLTIPAVQEQPSPQHVARAKEVIADMFTDFPFVDDADRAGAWALLLQPFARELIWGPTPLFAVEAPKQGTGKTVLVRTALAPALGEVPSMAEPHSDEEMEKRLTTALRNAAQVVFFDNVTRTVNYPSLASALTQGHWLGRVLGQSEAVHAPILCTWALTANNPQYSDDMHRRVVPIRLDANQPDPHRRSGFTHSLPADAIARRGELIWAACTLIAAWVAAGRPRPTEGVPHLATYGAWRLVLGGILTLHEMPGLLSNLPSGDGDEPSPEQEVLACIARIALDELTDGVFTSADLRPWIDDEPDIAALILPGARDTLAGRIGKFLRAHKGQVVDHDGERYRLVKLKQRTSGGMRWRFEPQGGGQ